MTTEIRCRECGKEFDGRLVDDGFGGVCPKCLARFALAEPAGEPTQLDQPMPLMPGATFRGMEVAELLGRGGMGVVYRARQVDLDRTVALKVLAPRLADDPEFARRFAREARALAALSHPHIVQVHDFGREGALYFLVMEHVDGVSLRELMNGRRLPPEEALRIVRQVCEALEAAHAQGVVHRDIKPENILIDRAGRVKIADFGLAKMAARDGLSTLTHTREALGTPHYMAPEQVERMKEVDHRADIYSLGVVFYEMLTGELPVGLFEPPSRRARVDARLDGIVMRALEKRPERRYQRVRHVKTDVETVMTTAKAPRGARPLGTPPVSRLAVAGVCVLVAGLALGDVAAIGGGTGAAGLAGAAKGVGLAALLAALVLAVASMIVIRRSGGAVAGRGYAAVTLGLSCAAAFGVLVVQAMSQGPVAPQAPLMASRKILQISQRDAVGPGLTWLARHQKPDGSWPARPAGCACAAAAPADAPTDVEATGLALWAFIGAGYSHLSKDVHEGICFGDTIKRGLQWLLDHQKVENRWQIGEDPIGSITAALALSEAYGLTGSNLFKDGAQRSHDWVLLQFRETIPRDAQLGSAAEATREMDATRAFWGILALKSADMSGLSTVFSTRSKAIAWLGLKALDGDALAASAYVFFRCFVEKSPPAGGTLLDKLATVRVDDDPLLVLVTTLALYHHDREAERWKSWDAALRGRLVGSQVTLGCERGSWGPDVRASALCVSALEVPYLYPIVLDK